MAAGDFASSVFLNCPFDKDYEPVLQAILFCLVHLGFTPRIASEATDSAELRLSKICRLIEESRFSIHDLSRCQSQRKNEPFRLNMPFELGIDYACRLYRDGQFKDKKLLVLEERPFRYQTAISDLAGCDIQHHGGDYELAVRKVRNWLVSEAKAPPVGARAVLNAYRDFVEWHVERQLAMGFDLEDINDYPTSELISAMIIWHGLGRPA